MLYSDVAVREKMRETSEAIQGKFRKVGFELSCFPFLVTNSPLCVVQKQLCLLVVLAKVCI